MSNPSPNLIFVGPSYTNIVPAKDPAEKSTAYLGGESPWAAIAAMHRIREEKQKTRAAARKAKKKGATVVEAAPARKVETPLIAAHLKGVRRQIISPDDTDIMIHPAPKSTDITEIKVTLVTTLGPDRTDLPSKTSYGLLRDAGMEIVSSPSRMPVDTYDKRLIRDSNRIGQTADKKPFDTEAASKELASIIGAQTIVVMNGGMLGNENATEDFFRIADLTHKRGGLVFADLRAPMSGKLVSQWAKKADIIKISYADSAELANTKTDSDAAIKFLKDGAKLVIISNGGRGASAWWTEITPTHVVNQKTSISSIEDVTATRHHALPTRTNYNTALKFKAGAALSANLALSLVKFGANAENLQSLMKVEGFMPHVGEDSVSNTTKFIKAADKFAARGPQRRPSVSRPLVTGETKEAILGMIYPRPV